MIYPAWESAAPSTCSTAYKSKILKFKLHFKLWYEGEEEDTTEAAQSSCKTQTQQPLQLSVSPQLSPVGKDGLP